MQNVIHAIWLSQSLCNQIKDTAILCKRISKLNMNHKIHHKNHKNLILDCLSFEYLSQNSKKKKIFSFFPVLFYLTWSSYESPKATLKDLVQFKAFLKPPCKESFTVWWETSLESVNKCWFISVLTCISLFPMLWRKYEGWSTSSGSWWLIFTFIIFYYREDEYDSYMKK